MIAEEERIFTRKQECTLRQETFIPSGDDTRFFSDKCDNKTYTNGKLFSHTQEVKKPFILKIGEFHNKILPDVLKYNILGVYDFSDIVDVEPTNISETCLIVRETGELLKTWYDPFNESYEFKKRYTQLCPDSIIYMSHLLIREFEVKTGRSFIHRAAMDYLARNSII